MSWLPWIAAGLIIIGCLMELEGYLERNHFKKKERKNGK